MQSRREMRPKGQGVLPEMHVSMKVNIVSDGPGGISFSQAVNTPGNYNGLYDFSNFPNDQQQLSIAYPEPSMLPWPASDEQKREQQTPMEPVVQMPTDTSQENLPEPNVAFGLAADKAKVSENGDSEKKKRHHHYHKHKHRKKEGELLVQPVSRSQSATSLATSTKVSQTENVNEIEKKHRRSKHKSTGLGVDDASSTSRSRRSNGERSSSVRASSSRHKKPEPPVRFSMLAPIEPIVVPSTAIASGPSSRISEPIGDVSGRKLDELLSEVVINTFADDESSMDNRAKARFGLPLNNVGRFPTRPVEAVPSSNSMEIIAGRRLLSPTNIPHDRQRYPIAVDTPSVPIITASQAVQADEPFQSERGIQTEQANDDKQSQSEKLEKKKKKKSKPSAEASEPSAVQDYLKHIAQATADLIEASRAVLEQQRAQTPQLYLPAEVEADKPVRIPKETLIDDPAIPPLDDDIGPQDWNGRSTPGLDTSYGRKGGDAPALDTSYGRGGGNTPALDSSSMQLKGSGSNSGDRSLEQPHFHHHHHHHHHHDQPQDEPAGIPGVYYIRTYCAVCGSPRSSRRAVDGVLLPRQDISPPIQPSPQPDHFLVHIRPNGRDEINQPTPQRSEVPPPPQFLDRNENEENVTIVRELDEIYFPEEISRPFSIEEGPDSTLEETRSKKITTFEPFPENADIGKRVELEFKNRSAEYLPPIPEAAHRRSREEPITASKSYQEERLTALEMEEITAQARARLRELQLLASESPSEEIQRRSPVWSTIAKSTEVEIITEPAPSERAPNGHSGDRPSPTSAVDLREALEQRRVQLAQQRERFFGPPSSQRTFDPELMAMYERNAVYVPPPSREQPTTGVFVQEPIYGEMDDGQQRVEDVEGFYESRSVVEYEEKIRTVISEAVQSKLDEKHQDDPEYADPSQLVNQSLEQQPRLMPSAKIFQLHTRSQPPSNYRPPDYAKRSSDSVQLFAAPTKIRVQSTSSESEISQSRQATAGSGTRSMDDVASSTGSTRRGSGDVGNERQTPAARQEDGPLDSVQCRVDQNRSFTDTLSSTGSGGSSQAQKRASDLYRKALLSQQSRKEAPSRGSSINSERSSISNVVRGKGTGAFTTAEIDRYLDDNLSDYAQERLTPFDEDWTVGSRASDTGSQSQDSLASETSYKADASHDFYAVPATPEPKSNSPVSLASRSRIYQAPTIQEKSFADIMKERSAARNARLAYFSVFGHQPPTLDRIDEDPDVERGFSRDRASSTATAESEKTLTDSIEREGSGVYAVKPSMGKVQSATKRSALLAAAVSGRDDAGSSSFIGSELENSSDYSQGRISPMLDVGNDYGTISSYGELRRDHVRTARRVNQDERVAPGFVGYGKAKERVIQLEQEDPSSSERVFERKRLRQTDL